jgi:hypothetical protein
MKTVEIKSWPNFHEEIIKVYGGTYVFRGVSNLEAFKLISRVGRSPLYDALREKSLLDEFKKRATPYLKIQPANEWDWLAIAQHHGLPTRLLDWSTSPLVAAYFAVNGDKEHSNTDAAVYGISTTCFREAEENLDPLSLGPPVQLLFPRHITPRIAAQSGVFTVHPEPQTPFTHNELHRFVISKELKSLFRQSLSLYGLHAGALFPDLEGQAELITWKSRLEL